MTRERVVHDSLKLFPSIATYIKLAERVAWLATVADQHEDWKGARMFIMSRDIDKAMTRACPWLAIPERIYLEQDNRQFVWDYRQAVDMYASHLRRFTKELTQSMVDSDAAEERGG